MSFFPVSSEFRAGSKVNILKDDYENNHLIKISCEIYVRDTDARDHSPNQRSGQHYYYHDSE